MPGPGNKQKKKKGKTTAQLGSLFMGLPREMRGEIYPHLFFSTRLVWGERSLGRISRLRITSAPNSLALLRTCRQIHAEIGTSWLQQVLFVFEDPNSMLDKLANIPSTTLALIQHARISGDPLMLSWEDDDVYYRTSQALKLLPGLALDRLTVLGTRGPEVCYQTLDMLVRHGAGWKELYYLSHKSTFLGYKDNDNWFGLAGEESPYLRVPQPEGWQRALEARDGATSGASVTIYRAKAPSLPGAFLDPARRAVFAQTLPPGCDVRTYATFEDAELMKDGECEKEILVVVKRGRGVDYAEKKDSPYHSDGDIREAGLGKTWKQIKASLPRWDEDDDIFDQSDDEDETDPGVEEKYDSVDEYVWPPLHFSND
ncbi:hypothetical protein GGX14DRAFT_701502 [Mycena pura]|uniref:F-box domain-containing protein n=1 Tax=Mycena pura TaxID=153505 RepID=A0AAD6UPU6_9AGAR|nr:hypothetical protein GGX14DRAFT_701502 [Mycena pura]